MTTTEITRPSGPVITGVLALTGLAFAGVPTNVDVLTTVGAAPPGGDGSAITSLNTPFTNALGQAGFTGVLASGERFVWLGDQVVWLNGHALPDHVLTGTEATMGISDAGGWIYSPSTDGEDSVFTHDGLLFRGDDPAPGIPGRFLTFNSRPIMKPDGTAWWVAGTSATAGGAASGRALYKCADTADPDDTTTPILDTAVPVEGFMMTTSGIGFGYDVSDDSSQVIVELTMAGVPTTTNTFIYVNGELPLRRGNPVGGDDPTTWNLFRSPSINNDGDWIIAGNTSGGPTANNEYLAVNGAIAMRRGDVIGGVELLSTWAVRWASINNLGQVAYIWEGGSGASLAGALFVGHGCDLYGTSVAVARIGEAFDTDGDGSADVVVTDFEASAAIAPGLDFSDHPWVYADVELRDLRTSATFESVVRFPVPDISSCGSCPADLNGDGAVDGNDLAIVLGGWGSCGESKCPADINGDGQVDGNDLAIVLGGWGSC